MRMPSVSAALVPERLTFGQGLERAAQQQQRPPPSADTTRVRSGSRRHARIASIALESGAGLRMKAGSCSVSA